MRVINFANPISSRATRKGEAEGEEVGAREETGI